MLQDKILIIKSAASVDASLPGSVAVEKIAALNHESLDYTVEAGVFVALGLTLGILGFAGAELAEIFGGFGGNIFAELD